MIRTFPPRVFLASNSGHTTPRYLKLLELVRDRRITAIGPTDAPRRIELGSVALTVLPQPPEDPSEQNNNSIAIRVQHGAVSFLLAGDAEEAERAWWERRCPELLRDATVLKLCHHGSRNGTDSRWLALVAPKLAVASAGRGNSFGHPSPRTLSLLDRAKVPLLRTDEEGTIAVRSDGRRTDATTDRAARAPPAASRPAASPASRPPVSPASRPPVSPASRPPTA